MKKFSKHILFLLLALLTVVTMAACSKVDFKISFIVDGETYHTINTNGNEVIKMPNDPQKEGYDFDGWFWDKDVWLSPFTANSLLDAPLSENLNIYAKWITANSLIGTQASFEGFTQTGDGTYYLKVPNATTTLSLGNIVQTNARSTWILSSDIYGNNTIASKTATLMVGDNTWYVLVTANDTTSKLYTLSIRRRPIYNVIFDTRQGTSVASQQIEEDSFATAPTTTRTGYNFTGWNYNFENPITKNEIIVASWQAKTYTLQFNANGGDITPNQTTVTYDEIFTLPEPTRRGYTFEGWLYNDESFVEGIWTIDGGRTVTADWAIINYAIEYEHNGGTVDLANPISYTVADGIITLNNPTKTGYSFLGWTGTDLTGLTQTVTILANSIGDRSYTANWAKNDYGINYYLNGGNNDESNPDGYSIESASIYLKNATRTGYIFDGWYEEASFENRVTVIHTGSHGDIDLYAKWIPITYSIRFNGNGSTSGGMNNQTFTYDAAQNLTQIVFERTGYSFTGWTSNQDGSGTAYANGVSILNISETNGAVIDIYAQWDANDYEVTLNKQGGTDGSDFVTATYDSAMPTATAPAERDGYDFDGYYDAEVGGTQYYTATMQSARTWNKLSNTELYARWIPKTYDVTFLH